MIEALRAVLPVDAVLAGRSALWAHGVRVAVPQDPVEVILPAHRRIRCRPELVVHGVDLPADEVVPTMLGRATSAARTAVDVARSAALSSPDAARACRALQAMRPVVLGPSEARALAEAVSLIDAVLRQCRTSLPGAAALALRHRGARGAARIPLVLGLADPTRGVAVRVAAASPSLRWRASRARFRSSSSSTGTAGSWHGWTSDGRSSDWPWSMTERITTR
jgi:hypothetical protein